MKLQIKWIASAGLLVAGQALAVDRLDNVPDAKYLALGAQPQFGAVGDLLIRDSQGHRSHGTGTFIGFGNRMAWVMTAKHVLKGFATGSVFSVGGHSYNLGDNYTGPGGTDFAVIPITGVAMGDIPIAKYSNYALSVPADLSARTVLYGVGCGDSGTGSKPGTVDDHQKRAFTNTLDAYNAERYQDDGVTVVESYLGYMTDFDDGSAKFNTLDSVDNPTFGWPKAQRSSRTAGDLEGGADQGDSGGPVFSEQGDGTWLVVGVITESNAGTSAGKSFGYGSLTQSIALDEKMALWIKTKTGIPPITGGQRPEEALRAVLYGSYEPYNIAGQTFALW